MALAVREVGMAILTPRQTEGRNQQHRRQATPELTCGTLTDEDDDDDDADDYDDAAIFSSDTCNFGGVGP